MTLIFEIELASWSNVKVMMYSMKFLRSVRTNRVTSKGESNKIKS